MKFENQVYQFIQDIQKFIPWSERNNPDWKILFPDKEKKWHIIEVIKHDDLFYVVHSNDDKSLEVLPQKFVKLRIDPSESNTSQILEGKQQYWLELFRALKKWLRQVEKDWLKASRRVQKEYPYCYRYGTIQANVFNDFLPNSKRLHKKLGKRKTATIIQAIEPHLCYTSEYPILESMTVSKYLEYCRFAFTAIYKDIDQGQSDRTIYELYANIPEGLLDIDPDSESAFSNWLTKQSNPYNHRRYSWRLFKEERFSDIKLKVERLYGDNINSYTIILSSYSGQNTEEVLNIFLTIHSVELPVRLFNAATIYKQLLEHYKIGLLPNYQVCERIDEFFLYEEEVLQIVKFENLKVPQKEILPFVQWKHLPLLKPIVAR